MEEQEDNLVTVSIDSLTSDNTGQFNGVGQPLIVGTPGELHNGAENPYFWPQAVPSFPVSPNINPQINPQIYPANHREPTVQELLNEIRTLENSILALKIAISKKMDKPEKIERRRLGEK